MGQALAIPPPGFEALSVEEQIDYVQALWDRIAAGADRVAVPEWHKQIIDDRLAAYKKDPNAGVPWDELRSRLLSGSGSGG